MNITKTSRDGVTLIWDEYDLNECAKAVCSVNGRGRTEDDIKNNIFSIVLSHIDSVRDPEFIGTGGWYVIFSKASDKENTYKCKMVLMSYVVNEYVKEQKKIHSELLDQLNTAGGTIRSLSEKLDELTENLSGDLNINVNVKVTFNE